jgi:hypothetical protein
VQENINGVARGVFLSDAVRAGVAALCQLKRAIGVS